MSISLDIGKPGRGRDELSQHPLKDQDQTVEARSYTLQVREHKTTKYSNSLIVYFSSESPPDSAQRQQSADQSIANRHRDRDDLKLGHCSNP
jgi:hypothetical protein